MLSGDTREQAKEPSSSRTKRAPFYNQRESGEGEKATLYLVPGQTSRLTGSSLALYVLTSTIMALFKSHVR